MMDIASILRIQYFAFQISLHDVDKEMQWRSLSTGLNEMIKSIYFKNAGVWHLFQVQFHLG